MRLLSIACVSSLALACGAGTEPPQASVAAADRGEPARARRDVHELPGSFEESLDRRVESARPEQWILGIQRETETTGEGISREDGAYELVLPEQGAFTAETVLRLREYPRRIAGCTILSSAGYDTTALRLDGTREGARIRLRETAEARDFELTMECDDLVLTTPTSVPAREHGFELRLRDGETHEYLPPVEGTGRRIVVRYTLKSRALVDVRIQARRRPESPIELCTPTEFARERIQQAIETKDHGTAIDLGAEALGLERLEKSLSIQYDPSIVDPDSFGGCSEDLAGRITIKLGPQAFQDASILLSTLLHEAVGHAMLGLSEHDPEYSRRWEVEELAALEIEQMSATVLGLSTQQLARIGETLARRRAALKERDPALEAEIGHETETADRVSWISCKDG